MTRFNKQTIENLIYASTLDGQRKYALVSALDQDEEARIRITAALASLEEEPLKEGDRIELNQGFGCIRIERGYAKASWCRAYVSLDMMLPLIEMAIRGGATIERAG